MHPEDGYWEITERSQNKRILKQVVDRLLRDYWLRLPMDYWVRLQMDYWVRLLGDYWEITESLLG